MTDKNKATPLAAMGREDGDYLKLSNQWATLFVTREIRDVYVPFGPQAVTPARNVERIKYVVTGDTWDGDPTSEKQNAPSKAEYRFSTTSSAMRFAMQSLAAYEHGAARHG